MTEIYVPESPPVMETEDGRRLAEYLSRQFLNIRSEFDFPKVGRAGLGLSVATPSTTLVTQTPAKITGFDSAIAPELSAEANLANSTISLLTPGLWYLSVKGVVNIVAHTANYARGIVVELYNETTSQTYKVIDYAAIARYEDLVDYTISIPLFVSLDVVGHDLALYFYATTTNSIQLTQIQILDFRFILFDSLLISTP